MNARFERLAAGLFFLLLLAVQLAPLKADGASQPVVTVTVTPDSVLVGDRIHCTINLRHPASETVTVENTPPALAGAFELISKKQLSSAPRAGSRKESFEFEYAVFGAGQQPLPPFTVTHRDGAGTITKKVTYSPSSSVFVRALTDSTMHELRPIKPPLKPSIPLLLIMPVILGALGTAGVVLLLLFLVKRFVRKSAEDVDSGQVAQRKLRKLGSSLSAGMPPHECYEELSNIMRTFLETHYRISALEAVTQEIERDLKKLGVAGFESIMNLLKQADLVKFADSRPDAEESRQSLHKASEVIKSTRKSARNSNPPEDSHH